VGLVIGGVTAEAAIAPMITPASGKSGAMKSKAKKRGGFKSMFGKSVRFLGESAVMGGASDR
jgi:hypothetical protein